MKNYKVAYIAQNAKDGKCELHAVAKHTMSEERIAIPNLATVSDEVFQDTFAQDTCIQCDSAGVIYINKEATEFKRHPGICGVPK